MIVSLLVGGATRGRIHHALPVQAMRSCKNAAGSTRKATPWRLHRIEPLQARTVTRLADLAPTSRATGGREKRILERLDPFREEEAAA